MWFDLTSLKTASQLAEIQARGANTKGAASKQLFYSTQDQTSLYEEYLFGRAVYAEGGKKQTWSDTMQGRSSIRLLSRGIFGAAAFTWGGRVSARQLQNYDVGAFKYSFSAIKQTPLQAVAKTLDTILGTPIHAAAKKIAQASGHTAREAESIANRTVRFRQKAYYHSEPGKAAGRSLGAEMVAITFDFASASTADATMRNVVQLFDPNIEKPWNENGQFSAKALAKNTAEGAWRVFSKNQGEDWAAALPYIFQMKLQRQAIARFAPGFKLTSDMAVNGASMVINKQGKIIGDFQKAGILDLQMRFMGYNWYTLMYREMYDNIGHSFTKWKEDGFKVAAPNLFELPVNIVENAAKATRYVAKSAIKSGLYMLPSVPFFWVFRVPQTKWRAPLIMDTEALSGDKVQNAFVMRENIKFDEHVRRWPAYGDALEINAKTAPDDKRVWQGGIHTNSSEKITQGYICGEKLAIEEMGGDAPFKFKNQKTLAAKLLNPFGWISYKLGSGLVGAGDALAKNNGNVISRILPKNARDREVLLRSFTDASLSYTPYMIAKSEFALRMDDRGAKRELGNMDKAIYQVIDSATTFDMEGLQDATRKIGTQFLKGFSSEKTEESVVPTAATMPADNKANPAQKPAQPAAALTKTATGTPHVPATTPTPKSVIDASSIQAPDLIPQLKSDTKSALTHPSLTQNSDQKKSWEESVKASQNKPQTFLFPETRTLQ